MTNNTISKFVLFVFVLQYALCSNILIVSPLPSTSHYYVIKPIIQQLVKNNHNLTVISVAKENLNSSNYHHIQVDVALIEPADFSQNSSNERLNFLREGSLYKRLIVLWDLLVKVTEKSLNSEAVQLFLRNDNYQFDLIICEDINTVPFYMLAYKYKTPLVTFYTNTGAHYINEYMGNPMNLQNIPNEFMDDIEDFNIWNRIKSVVFTMIYILLRTYVFMPKFNELAKTNFANLPQPLPHVSDIEKNISLAFINTHFSIDYVRPLLPNVVEFAGVHVKKPLPLPKDLKEVMDNAKNGVIYFSMGSMLKTAGMSQLQIEALLKVFSMLNQTILFKWEKDDLPNKPDNVVPKKWFPQSDVLAHPNMRLFISHGGSLGTIEAIYRGIPIVGIPVLADQPGNIARLKRLGVAESVDYTTLSQETLQPVIEKMLNDSSYINKAKYYSKLINDKPLTAMDSTIYWIEYVIRHKGAYHLKTPSSWMSWYQYYLLDVTGILAVILCTVFAILIFMVKQFTKLLLKLAARENRQISNTKKKLN